METEKNAIQDHQTFDLEKNICETAEHDQSCHFQHQVSKETITSILTLFIYCPISKASYIEIKGPIGCMELNS